MFRVETEGRSNPFLEISAVVSHWFVVGVVCGAALLATAQYALQSLNQAVTQQAAAQSTTETAATEDDWGTGPLERLPVTPRSVARD